jgi:hypothetical protein
MGSIPQNGTIKPVNDGIVRADQPCGILGHSVKYRL